MRMHRKRLRTEATLWLKITRSLVTCIFLIFREVLGSLKASVNPGWGQSSCCSVPGPSQIPEGVRAVPGFLMIFKFKFKFLERVISDHSLGCALRFIWEC